MRGAGEGEAQEGASVGEGEAHEGCKCSATSASWSMLERETPMRGASAASRDTTVKGSSAASRSARPSRLSRLSLLYSPGHAVASSSSPGGPVGESE